MHLHLILGGSNNPMETTTTNHSRIPKSQSHWTHFYINGSKSRLKCEANSFRMWIMGLLCQTTLLPAYHLNSIVWYQYHTILIWFIQAVRDVSIDLPTPHKAFRACSHINKSNNLKLKAYFEPCNYVHRDKKIKQIFIVCSCYYLSSDLTVDFNSVMNMSSVSVI